MCLLSFAPDETATCFERTDNLDLCSCSETERMQSLHHWPSLFTQLFHFGGAPEELFPQCRLFCVFASSYPSSSKTFDVCGAQIEKDVQVAGSLVFEDVGLGEDRLDTHPECPQRRLNSLRRESASAVSGAETPAAPSASLSITDVLL